MFYYIRDIFGYYAHFYRIKNTHFWKERSLVYEHTKANKVAIGGTHESPRMKENQAFYVLIPYIKEVLPREMDCITST